MAASFKDSHNVVGYQSRMLLFYIGKPCYFDRDLLSNPCWKNTRHIGVAFLPTTTKQQGVYKNVSTALTPTIWRSYRDLARYSFKWIATWRTVRRLVLECAFVCVTRTDVLEGPLKQMRNLYNACFQSMLII